MLIHCCFGTILLIFVGIMNYYKEYNGDLVVLTNRTDENKLSISSGPDDGTKAVYSKDIINIKNHLEIATEYLKKKLIHHGCDESLTNSKSNPGKSSFKEVIVLIGDSANNYYLSQKGIHSAVLPEPQNTTAELLKLMSSECEPQLTANRKILQKFYQFLNMYHKHFPTEVDDYNYKKCYLESLLELTALKYKVLFDFEDTTLSRISLETLIIDSFQKIKECITLKRI